MCELLLQVMKCDTGLSVLDFVIEKFLVAVNTILFDPLYKLGEYLVSELPDVILRGPVDILVNLITSQVLRVTVLVVENRKNIVEQEVDSGVLLGSKVIEGALEIIFEDLGLCGKGVKVIGDVFRLGVATLDDRVDEVSSLAMEVVRGN